MRTKFAIPALAVFMMSAYSAPHSGEEPVREAPTEVIVPTVSQSPVSNDTSKPYVCETDASRSLSEKWKTSWSRGSLDNSTGTFKASPARIARGKTYVDFMDAFYTAFDAQTAGKKPETVGEFFEEIEKAFKKADSVAGSKVRRLGTTPDLVFTTFGYDDVTVTLSSASGENLVNSPEMQELLESGDFSIHIGFMRDGNFLYMELIDNIGRDKPINLDSKITDLIGFEDRNAWLKDGGEFDVVDDPNLRDDFICELK